MRVGIFVTGALSTVMALTIPTIYGLWGLSSDLVYCILFPQLCMVVHFKHHCNTYGSLAGYIVGLLVRMSGGEKVIKLSPLIYYPGYDYANNEQQFPFRTLAMLMCAITLIGVSKLTKDLFESHTLAPKWDIFKCVVNVPPDVVKFPTPTEGELTVMNSAAVQKYAATAELNGRVNPGLSLDDSDDEDAPPRPPPVGKRTSTTSSGTIKGGASAGGRRESSNAKDFIKADGMKEEKVGITSL